MTLMTKEETLRRIKEAEEEAKKLREATLVEKDKFLLEARREQFDLRESLRLKAEKRAGQILKKAEEETKKDTDKILAKGRKEAEALRAASAENIDHAVDHVIEKFKGALGA